MPMQRVNTGSYFTGSLKTIKIPLPSTQPRKHPMIAKQLFEEAASKISETLANSPAKDLEKNAKAMLGSAFNKMDLVTREEYDIQQQILIKTRVKLTELEARLAQLEAQLAPQANEAEANGAQTAEPNPEKTTTKRKPK